MAVHIFSSGGQADTTCKLKALMEDAAFSQLFGYNYMGIIIPVLEFKYITTDDTTYTDTDTEQHQTTPNNTDRNEQR